MELIVETQQRKGGNSDTFSCHSDRCELRQVPNEGPLSKKNYVAKYVHTNVCVWRFVFGGNRH